MQNLAINGGPKTRTEPFPSRRPFGQKEEELLIEAVRSQTLFGKSGTFVKQLEEVCGGSVEIDDFKLNWQLFPRGILYPFPPFGPRLPLTVPFHCD